MRSFPKDPISAQTEQPFCDIANSKAWGKFRLCCRIFANIRTECDTFVCREIAKVVEGVLVGSQEERK